jgi:5-methylcytosine-specific restriction endonuclease McrA
MHPLSCAIPIPQQPACFMILTCSPVMAVPDSSSPCACEESGPRERTLKNGRKVYATQCKKCGKFMRNIAKRESLPAEGVYNEDLHKQYWESRLEQRAAEREEESRAWRHFYRQHLASAKWRATREKVIKRAGGVCEGCRDRSINDVHHLTYEHLGDELLFELVGLCSFCHQKIHYK